MPIAVLPVPRSPMISSQLAAPIGTMESMDFRPVCSGTLTGCLSAMPGALISMSRYSSVLDFRLAVDWLSERVYYASDNCIAHRNLHQVTRSLTTSPSLMVFERPRRTAPTLLSRLSAMPYTPFEVRAVRRPCTLEGRTVAIADFKNRTLLHRHY